jgi:hypothetical protein
MWTTDQRTVDLPLEDLPRALHQQNDRQDDPHDDAQDESAHALRVSEVHRLRKSASASLACRFVTSAELGFGHHCERGNQTGAS